MEENLTLEKFYYNEVYQELANLHVPATHNNYGEVADWFKHHLDALQDKRNNDEDDTAVVENLTLTSLNLESESSALVTQARCVRGHQGRHQVHLFFRLSSGVEIAFCSTTQNCGEIKTCKLLVFFVHVFTYK